jgi:hypothetical protein
MYTICFIAIRQTFIELYHLNLGNSSQLLNLIAECFLMSGIQHIFAHRH